MLISLGIISLSILAILFFLLTVLVMRKSTHIINIVFATGTFILACSLTIIVIGTINNNDATILDIGYFLSLIAPLGIYYSGQLILFGDNAWKRPYPFVFSIIYLLITVLLIFTPALDFLNTQEAEILGSFLSFLLYVLSFIVYRQIYFRVPELQAKLTFLLLGILTIIGIHILDMISFYLNQDASVLYFFSIIGFFLVTIAFTNTPFKEKASSKDNTNDYSQ